MTTIPESTLIDGKPSNDLESAKFTKDKETVDVIQPTAKLIGLTKEQLEQYRNDPFWKTVRYGLFIAFWLVWLAMFIGAILIVVMSPKCVDVKWQNKMVAYKIFSLAFKNSEADGDGKNGLNDFIGIKEKLGELKDMGVSAIWPTPILDFDKNERTPDAIENLKVDDKELGGQAKFKDLVKSAHAKDMKVIVDLPLTVRNSDKSWVKGIQDAVKEGKGPVSALNLKNQKVQESLVHLAREYIEWGIDGINLANYGLGSNDLTVLIQKIREIAGAEHMPLYFDDKTFSTNGGDNYRIESLVGNEAKETKELVANLHSKLDEIIKQRKIGKNATMTTVWSLGSIDSNGHRVDELLKDTSLTPYQKQRIAFLFTMVQLSIPGPISVLYGEELALLSGNQSEKMKTNFVIYPWDNSTERGSNFVSVSKNAASNNFESQKKQENSALNIFSKLAKMHQQNDFILGEFKRVTLGNLEIYLVKRNPNSISNYYGLIINWNGNDNELDGAGLSSKINSKKINIIASTDANFRESLELDKDDNKVKISAFGAVAFQTE